MIWYMFHYCLPVRWNELITFTFVLKPCNSSTSQRLIYNSIVTKKCMSRLSWINSLVMTEKQFALVHDQIHKNYGDSNLFLLFTCAYIWVPIRNVADFKKKKKLAFLETKSFNLSIILTKSWIKDSFTIIDKKPDADLPSLKKRCDKLTFLLDYYLSQHSKRFFALNFAV